MSTILGTFIPEQRAILGTVLIALCGVGFLCAVAALARIVRDGWRRVVIPACVGLLISGGVIYLAVYVTAFVKARM